MVLPGEVIGCVDEVGRGSLAGPVSVGLVFIDPHLPGAPDGVRDSKELSLSARERMAPLVKEWILAGAVGHASALEIDEFGIVAALRLAGRRAWNQALASLAERGGYAPPRVAVLDGNLNWLSPVEADLFGAPEPGDAEGLLAVDAAVYTRVKGDRDCLGVGAASILAKVERDELMLALDEQYPAYGWQRNKGYGSAEHKAAIAAHGATEAHRRTWKLL